MPRYQLQVSDYRRNRKDVWLRAGEHIRLCVDEFDEPRAAHDELRAQSDMFPMAALGLADLRVWDKIDLCVVEPEKPRVIGKVMAQCPDCKKVVKRQGLGAHRRKAHGVTKDGIRKTGDPGVPRAELEGRPAAN